MHRRRIKRAIVLVAAIGAIPSVALGASTSWTFNGNGSWTLASNWSNGVPVGGSDVFIRTGGTITYDYAGSSIQFNSMKIDNTSTGSFAGSSTFSQSANTFNSFSETIGDAGRASWTLSGGTHNVTGSGSVGLAFGSLAGSRGTGTLTAGTLNVNTGEIFAGYDGNGTFTQSGGQLSAYYMTMGRQPDGAGTYNLSAGTANIGSALFVGDGGNGTVNLSGGTLSAHVEDIGSEFSASGQINQTAGVNVVSGNGMAVGDSGTGTYLLSGTGSLTVNGPEYVGFTKGTFNQSGGTHTVGSTATPETLMIGVGFGSIGSYSFSGGALTVNGTEIVGNTGLGTFNQTGGVHTIGSAAASGSLQVGYASGAGTYLLSASGSLTVNGIEAVGVQGSGTFNQSGGAQTIGSITAAGSIDIGQGSFGIGNYFLSAGSLTVNGKEIVGDAGTATFNQTGGVHTIGSAPAAGSLLIGNSFGGAGTYLLSASGSLTVNGTEGVGVDGSGTFNQSGGAQMVGAVLAPGTLAIGRTFGSIGNYSLSAGALTVNGTLTVGDDGMAIFNQSSGVGTIGSATAAGSLLIGNSSLGFGTYLLSATGSLTVNGMEAIGVLGRGTFNQSGGAQTVGGIDIGQAAGGNGTYLLSAGSLTVNGTEIVGDGGTGIFVQIGGIHVVGSGITVGKSSGGTGTYVLSSGALSIHGEEIVGNASSSGTFSQSSGVQTVDQIEVGSGSGAIGNYFLSNSASLTVNNAEIIGDRGAGTFNQSGGGQEIGIGAGDKVIGLGEFNGTGTYIMSGGSVLLHGRELVGFTGNGTFNQSGGIQTLIGIPGDGHALEIGHNNAGTYLLSNSGFLSVSPDEVIGVFSSGMLIQTGGTHVVASASNPGSLQIGAGAAGTYQLSDGTLTVFGVESIAASGVGTFSQSGGMITVNGEEDVGANGAGTFNQSGGAHVVGSASALGVIEIGSFSGSVGNYFLSGNGSLTVNGYEFVGDSGAGTFNQSGGALTVNIQDIGVSGAGTFIQSGGTQQVGLEVVGDRGAGTFNQSGGSQTITTGLALGNGSITINSFGKGTYLLSSTGSLTVNGLEEVGVSGAGTFNQSGGTQQVGAVSQAGTLDIAAGPTGAGTYLLGGTSSLIVNGLEVVGLSGAGTFNQSGGTNWVVGELDICGGGTGTYFLSGGTLSATTVNVNAHGTLNFSGGTLSTTTLNLNAGGTLLFSGGTLSGGTGNIKRGVFSVPSGGNAQSSGTLNFQSPGNAGDPTAQISIDGTLTHTGTLVTDNTFLGGAGTLVLTSTSTFRGSGELNVSVVNNSGTIVGDAGDLLLTGNTLNNTGTLKNLPGGSLFVRPASLANLGNVIVNAGGAVSFDPPLTNPNGHTISLLGGVLAAPSVTNSLGGAISGFGQITGDFINSGSVSFIGPTQIVGNFTNNAGGVVAVRNAQTLVVGTAINNGSITTSNGTIIFDSGAPGPALGGGVDGAGSMLVNPGTHLITSFVRQSALSIGGTPGDAGIAIVRAQSDGGTFSILSALTISGSPGSFSGMLDLADNDAIVTSTPINTIAGYVAGGFAGGSWTGNGLTSRNAAAIAANSGNPHKTAVGYATASSIGVNSFDGQTVSGSNALLRYTWSGDANLDGKVNALDFNALASNFGGANGKFWTQGDFNYDGTTNTLDFNVLASNFNQALPAPGLGSVVPEPSLAAAMLSGLLMLRRIRRK